MYKLEIEKHYIDERELFTVGFFVFPMLNIFTIIHYSSTNFSDFSFSFFFTESRIGEHILSVAMGNATYKLKILSAVPFTVCNCYIQGFQIIYII